MILKFWMHLWQGAQKKRLRRFEKDPLTRWRVTKEQWKHWRMFDKFVAAAERDSAHQHRPCAVAHRRGRGRALSAAIVVGTEMRDAIRASRTARDRRSHRAPAKARARARTTASDRSGRERAVQRPRQARHDAARSKKTPSRSDCSSEQGRLNLLQRRRAEERRLDDPRVRGLGRGRQGWRDPARHRRARCARLPGDSRSPRRPTRSARTTTCGASGVTCPAPGASRSSIAAGTDRVLVERVEGFATEPNGCAPTPRSTSSRSSSSTTASSWSSSGSTSRRTSS